MNPALAHKSGVNRAFTLIELLVVIAIIAVLAGMLLPVLSIAKNRAQMAVDLNNVHQIILAFHLYASDNNDYLPQKGVNSWPDTMSGAPYWLFSRPDGIAPDNTYPNGSLTTYTTYYPIQVNSFHGLRADGSTLPRNYQCQLVPYLHNEKVLRCPGDIPSGKLFYERQVYISSYVATSLMCVGPSVTINSQNLPSSLKLGQFSPAGILMWENDELKVTLAGQWNDAYNDPSGGISARYGKGATVGRFSGVVERIPLADYYRMANSSGGPNDCWCNPLTSNGH